MFVDVPHIPKTVRDLYLKVPPGELDKSIRAHLNPSSRITRANFGKTAVHHSDHADDFYTDDSSDYDESHTIKAVITRRSRKRNLTDASMRPRVPGSGRALKQLFGWEDTSWEGKILPDSLIKTIDECKIRHEPNPCPVLALLGLVWDAELGCVICLEHARLLAGHSIRDHFVRGHAYLDFSKSTKNTFLMAAVHHLATCYPILRHQTLTALISALPNEITAALPLGPESVSERYKCPENKCTAWVPVNRNTQANSRGSPQAELSSHISKIHKKRLRVDFSTTLERRWVQTVTVGSGKSSTAKMVGSTHYFLLPLVFLPQLGRIPLNRSIFTKSDQNAFSTDTWPHDLGWEGYLLQLSGRSGDRSKIVMKLIDLVALPSNDRVALAKGTTKIIEQCLMISNKLNIPMLQDGVLWVSQLPPSLRMYFAYSRYAYTFKIS